MEKSYETIFNLEEFVKHLVLKHVLNMSKVFIFEKDNNKTWTECCEKWSEYHTCRGCEDEVNRKGHLTNPQKAVHFENVKNDSQLWGIHKTSSAITCIQCGKWWKNSHETIFNFEEFIKHLVLQHVLNTTKVIFLRKIITKH